ncbi:hypothetical protein [Inediibacterium massiliense]|uniref:hypothetical protein n=1 Tax=Inediibacterium massiliense TaxID=1658111 RepID=UPI0006B55B1F|nr:hypothetical protein [Inediibacterium massiliense]
MISSKSMKDLSLSILFGILIIVYLVGDCHIERVSIVCITIFLYTFIKNIKIKNVYSLWVAILGIIIGMCIGGYNLHFFEYESNVQSEGISIEKNHNTAVLLIFDGEPMQYNIPILLYNMNRKPNIKDKILMPYELYSYKRIYEEAGMSRYIDTAQKIHTELKNKLDHGYDVYVSYLNNTPYYSQVIQMIIKGNYEKIVVAPVFLTETKDYEYIVHTLEVENLYKANDQIKFMPSLWDSEKIPKSIANKIVDTEYKKVETGIILMGSVFEKMDRSINPKALQQERVFMDKIKEELISIGYEERKIKFVQMRSKKEEIEDSIQQLQQYGVGKIFLIGVDDIVDKIEDQHYLKDFIKEKKTESIEFEYMKGWGKTNQVTEELEFRIRLMNVDDWSIDDLNE